MLLVVRILLVASKQGMWYNEGEVIDMRLIDADSLINNIMIPSNLSSLAIQIHETIQNEPTVDAVLVNHGHWEQLPDYDKDWGFMEYYKCSRCGFVEFEMSKYCPGCGARMDGD